MSEYRLAVIGAPRSGTRFTSKVLRAWGLDIKHHGSGEDGIVDPYAPGQYPWMLDPLDTLVLHQVRNPYKVVRSLAACGWMNAATKWLGWAEATQSLRHRVDFYLEWTGLCDRISAWRYRVEDLPLCRHNVPTDDNHIDTPPVDWSELNRLSRALLSSRARYYGYDEKEPWDE